MPSTRLLTIAAELSAPPSSPSVFRDVTLQASIRGYVSVALAPAAAIDAYAKWFRRYGLWDYLDDLLPEGTVLSPAPKVIIVGGPDARLTAHSLHAVLAAIRS